MRFHCTDPGAMNGDDAGHWVPYHIYRASEAMKQELYARLEESNRMLRDLQFFENGLTDVASVHIQTQRKKNDAALAKANPAAPKGGEVEEK